jgi:type IV secretory pathway ATPase VirB11/archaellum biosynthesis ATPase
MNAVDRLENSYRFECEAGPLRNCIEWRQIKTSIAAAIKELMELRGDLVAIGKPTDHVDTALAALAFEVPKLGPASDPTAT